MGPTVRCLSRPSAVLWTWDRPCGASAGLVQPSSANHSASCLTGKTSSYRCDCKSRDARLALIVSPIFQKRNVFWTCTDATAGATDILEEYNFCIYTVRNKAATRFKVSTEASYSRSVRLWHPRLAAGRSIGTFRNTNSYVNNSRHNEVCITLLLHHVSTLRGHHQVKYICVQDMKRVHKLFFRM